MTLHHSVFETSIRYLGGILSAYELSGEKFPILVEKAKQVADKMAFAWEGVSVTWLRFRQLEAEFDQNKAIPFNQVDFSTNKAVSGLTNIAQLGTLTMEWGTLTKHTGNDTYRQLAEKAVKALMALTPPLPGLPAQTVDPSTGTFVNKYVVSLARAINVCSDTHLDWQTWGGGSDSYLEYLIKYPRLTNTNDTSFVTAWKTAVDTSIGTLLRVSDHRRDALHTNTPQ
jgi:mannosyl-oligosaccharide alpha-1,2-mannosidase